MAIKNTSTIREMIEAIAGKQLKIKDVAGLYGVSERTIQLKVKKMGFVWSPKEALYEFKGDFEGVYDLTLDEAFKPSEKAVKGAISGDSSSPTKKATKPATKKVTKAKNTSNSTSDSMDSIDRILAGKQANKKAYRGFYLDSDVLNALDNLDEGVGKSELVNECLRIVFKEKGLI